MAGPRDPAPRSTLADVAALAGVSVRTVSRVLNDSPAVSDAARESVLAAARMLRFRPNALARDLRGGGTSRAVGLVIADIANPFYSSLAASAERVFRGAELELVIASTDEDAERERAVVRTMLERRVRALMLVPASDDQSYLRDEAEHGTIIGILDREATNLAVDSWVTDNVAAAVRLVRDLAEQGHTRIAVVADEQSAQTAQGRLTGCEDTLRELGLYDDELVRIGAHTPAQAEELTKELVALPNPPTALIGLNNLITLGVVRGLLRTGSRAALRGVDDLDLAEVLGISVVSTDPAQMGALAAQRILDRLGGESPGPERTVLPMDFIGRTPLPGTPWEQQ